MTRPCGCKGVRTCLVCEEELGITRRHECDLKENATKSYVYCPSCNLAWPGWDCEDCKSHPEHSGESLKVDGVFVQVDFLSDAEEKILVDGCDSIPWDLSQSGRRKQNYGPKCNFKKRKMKLGDFDGFPKFSEFVQMSKFPRVPLLHGYRTIEQCSLEYTPTRGSSIEPHIDDCWVWGERVVSVNLLSDSVLTLSKYERRDAGEKYNLMDPFESYVNIVRQSEDGSFKISSGHGGSDDDGVKDFSAELGPEYDDVVIRVPMPRKSLLVLYGEARYCFEHSVLREDIVDRRICIAYREFTPPFLEGGERWESHGKAVVEHAEHFF